MIRVIDNKPRFFLILTSRLALVTALALAAAALDEAPALAAECAPFVSVLGLVKKGLLNKKEVTFVENEDILELKGITTYT